METNTAITSSLKSGASLVIDGALATELEARGLNITSPVWSASAIVHNPDVIRNIHLGYYLAGANIAITASYQATHKGLKEHLDYDHEQSSRLISKSVDLAKQARGDARLSPQCRDQPLFVAGSVGPYGAYLADGSEYTAKYNLTAEQYKEFHRPRVQVLVDAGVDLLAFETLPSYGEAEALLQLIKEEYPETVAWFSFTLKDASHISDGTSAEHVSSLLATSSQTIAIGFNCIPITLVRDALAAWRPHTSKPLLCYPNSGEGYDATTNSWTGQREGGRWEDLVPTWAKAGATMVGGCCRTGPADIKVIAEVLAKERQQT